jgi:hypothetical protein
MSKRDYSAPAKRGNGCGYVVSARVGAQKSTAPADGSYSLPLKQVAADRVLAWKAGKPLPGDISRRVNSCAARYPKKVSLPRFSFLEGDDA